MKVRIAVTVEVDPEAWELNYGTEREELREDVRRYVLGCIDDSAAALDGCMYVVRGKGGPG